MLVELLAYLLDRDGNFLEKRPYEFKTSYGFKIWANAIFCQ